MSQGAMGSSTMKGDMFAFRGRRVCVFCRRQQIIPDRHGCLLLVLAISVTSIYLLRKHRVANIQSNWAAAKTTTTSGDVIGGSR